MPHDGLDELGDDLDLLKRRKVGRPGLPGGSHKLTVMIDDATYAQIVELTGKGSMGAAVRRVLAAGLASERVK